MRKRWQPNNVSTSYHTVDAAEFKQRLAEIAEILYSRPSQPKKSVPTESRKPNRTRSKVA